MLVMPKREENFNKTYIKNISIQENKKKEIVIESIGELYSQRILLSDYRRERRPTPLIAKHFNASNVE